MRTRLMDAIKDAMRAKEQDRLSTLRLINAAIKDRDIALRASEDDVGCSDDEILSILGKMVKQRQESALLYDQGGREDLAKKERAEIKVIEEFLPKQMSEAEVGAAVEAAIAQTEASSLRDMGRIMGVLKERYAGQMDFGRAGGIVKAHLNQG